MPEWLSEISNTSVDATIPVLATRLLLAWLCGWIVAVLAQRKQPAGKKDTLTLTLVLMCILIAMATQIIGDNIARAFSLVGALSIVRFRTAVPATRDVAFVLAAVVVGMAIGAGQYWVTALGLIIVGLAAQFNSPIPAADKPPVTEPPTADTWRLTMQVGLNSMSNWEPELERMTDAHRLISAETVRRGGAMEFVYRLSLKPNCTAAELVTALNTTPTVESVALKAL